MKSRSAPGTAIVAGLLALSFAASTASAQDTGAIRGRVTNESGEYGFQGARVRIAELDRAVTTDRNGGFLIRDVPSGAHTLTIQYVGADNERVDVNVRADETAIATARLGSRREELLVVGQASGQAAALNRERSALNNIDVLSSDAIGQFPDQNVAEALARVPGISLLRDQGEGRFAVIRGMSPEFNSTTINGMRVPAPTNDTRAVNLDVIGSGLVESVEVSKSVTPDMDADAVGGNVGISTLTAFDLGTSFALTAEGSYDELGGDTSPRTEVTATRVFDAGEGTENFGIAVSLNYYDREFDVHNIEAGEWPELDAPGGGTVRSPNALEHRDYVLNRERFGGTLSFDFRPSQGSEYHIRTVYSRVDEFENELEHPYLYEDGTPVSLSDHGGTFENGVIERVGKSSTGTQEIYSINAGGRNELENWTLEYHLGHSSASDDTPDTIEALFLGEDLVIGYELADDRKQPDLFVENPGSDPASYGLDVMENEWESVEETENVLELDATRDTRIGGNPASLGFGVQARLRDKTNDHTLLLYEEFGGDYSLADFGATVDYPLGTFGPAVDNAAVRQFLNSNRDQFTLNEDDTAIENQLEDYSLDEDIYAAYLMAEVEIDRMSLLAGLRFEQTDVSKVGTQLTIDENVNDGAPVFDRLTAGNDYSDWFPNFQLRYRFNDRLELRSSVTRTIARPGFEDSAARQEIEIEGTGTETIRSAEVGNPDLKPMYSDNFELEVSYYPEGRLSVLSAGVFLKQIDDFFVATDVAGQPPFENFDEVTQVVNGPSADVHGIELKYVQQFGFLSAPWDGLLLAANYTLADSEADAPFRGQGIRLPNQAENMANLSIGYEKNRVSTRLAALYRDEYFAEANVPEDPTQDRFAAENLRLDFRGRFRVADNWNVLFNVINITEEPDYYYIGRPRYNSQYDQIGRTVEFGVRAEF